MNEEKLLYTIKKVAEELCLEQYVLRFWEAQFPQINPIKRNGRRLYDRKCIAKIRMIKHMLYDKGYTIKGAQKEFNKQLNDTETNCEKEHLKDFLQEMIDLKNYLFSKIDSEEDDK